MALTLRQLLQDQQSGHHAHAAAPKEEAKPESSTSAPLTKESLATDLNDKSLDAIARLVAS
ncbi:hypothetical protein LPJ81_005458, partial [Coemansia sp. IMI 209127]